MFPSRLVKRAALVLGAALVTVMVLGLTACGGGDEEEEGTPSGSTPAATAATPGGGATTEAGQPKYGGTIQMIGQYMGNTDPHIQPNQIATSQFWMVVSNQLFHATAGFGIEPDLAESWEQPSDTTLVLHIAKNVKWQNVPPTNGRAFTAADVKYNLDRISTPGPSYPYNETFKTITDVKVVDDYTVQLTLSQPYAYLLNALAIPALCMVSHEEVEAAGSTGIALEAVGTGPYIMTQYTPDIAANFKRNPDYWKKDKDGNQLPYLDGFDYLYIADPTAADAAFRSGQIQIGSITPTSAIPDYLKGHPEVADLVYTAANPYMMVMNNKVKPFDDVRVRQAVAYATNRADYGTVIYTNDWAPLYGPVPDIFEGWSVGEAGGIPYDPVKAKQLLTDAGYPDGFKVDALEATFSTNPYVQAAQVGQSQLKSALNIDINIVTDTLASWAAKAYRGEIACFWFVDQQFSLPSQYVDRRFHTGASGNWTFYSNAEVDKLIDDHYVQTDIKKAQQMLVDAQKIIVNEAPHTYLMVPVGHFMHYNYLHGFDPSVGSTGGQWFYQLETAWSSK